MRNMKKYLIPLLLTGLFIPGLQAYETGYVFQFNVDENLAGSDEPIVDANWNLHYGPTALDGGQAANTGSGDGSIVAGISEGGTGSIPKPLQQFSNNDRGFMFGSGVGDATTGFAPQALFFWTTNTTAVNVVQGAKGSGTIQSDWATPAFPPTAPLNTLTLADIIELSVQTLPRNVAMVYRFAFQIEGAWYVDAVGHTNATRSAWETYSMPIDGASVYPLAFTPLTELDIEVTDGIAVTVASLNQSAPITGYGIYVDTGDAKGSGNDTGTWCRSDAFYINAPAPVAPPIQAIGVGGGSFTIDADTATGLSYQLVRDTDLQGTFSTTVGSPVSGTGGTVVLEDPDYGSLGEDKVFYKIDTQLE
jgi:hypothetical protein